MTQQQNEVQVSVERLTRDLANASVTLSKGEARFLVDAYYAMQENRIRSNNQVRALSESQEPAWFDLRRLDVIDPEPVMTAPNFLVDGPEARGEKGPAEKPAPTF